MNLIDQMEADAALASEENVGKNLQELGRDALALENEIAALEGAAREKKKKLERIMRYSIPKELAQIGIDEFGVEVDGGTARIKMDTKVVGSLRNAPDEEEAVLYLEAEGLAGVVRSEVTMDFPEDERDKASHLAALIKGATNREPFVKRDINAQTLMAFVRAKLKEDPTFDYAKVGITAFPQAKFTKRA